MRPRDVALIRRWASINQDELQENWRRARQGERILKLKGTS
jgi:hypothetical protein